MLVHGCGIDFATDKRKLTYNESKIIIREILEKYYLSELDFKNSIMVRFFVSKFLDRGIKLTNIEKFFNVGHRRITRILES